MYRQTAFNKPAIFWLLALTHVALMLLLILVEFRFTMAWWSLLFGNVVITVAIQYCGSQVARFQKLYYLYAVFCTTFTWFLFIITLLLIVFLTESSSVML
ncbi:MAG: hypothetical protein HWE11_08980 [Gammaproteobacteria bacterium]|nr:hypothetical protein [Gammaproteobacteria bacterium]